MASETLNIITKSAPETQKLGEILSQEIIRTKFCFSKKTLAGLKNKKGLVIGLSGELGSGKTTFVQGLANGLRIKENITSPTFVILKKFDIPHQSSNIKHFYHIDCYRLSRSHELIDLGFREILNHSQNLIVIEWAERVRGALPQDTLWIKFEYLGQEQRKITIKRYE